MRGRIARALQVLGLILLPVGLLYGLLQNNIWTELTLLGVGGFVFAFGKLVLEPRT